MNGLRMVALCAAIAIAGPAMAQKGGDNGLVLPGASGKAPISVDADKLVYDDKAQTATYSGNVVVVQGASKLTCSVLTVHFERAGIGGGATPAADEAKTADPAGAASGLGSSSFKKLEAAGPVTVISKTQVATGDNATYDQTQKKIWLIGHVTLSDGANVTKGDKLIYDLASGKATIDNGPTGGRVHGLFIPGSGGDQTAPKN